MSLCINKPTDILVTKHGYHLYLALHCKPGEVYARLITATCEAGPGTTHMCTFEICVWSLQILKFADRCVFSNSIYGLSKCHLYIEIMKHQSHPAKDRTTIPSMSFWSISASNVSPARIDPTTFRSTSSSLNHYTMALIYTMSKCNKVKKKINFFPEN